MGPSLSRLRERGWGSVNAPVLTEVPRIYSFRPMSHTVHVIGLLLLTGPAL